ncbi:ABC transporter permease [Streptomyces sp. SS1-1]|uniref:ABC transporter permease n=1 Tax=Streptomyces sp. SS1-1 TaxID=2651869 RepID=UPI001250B7A6|nr:ABC transporter permease [Streptomyces sp. SS1-1]KAB2970856.1 ABC transporter permease [Streptomyces sp. SS1-1]
MQDDRERPEGRWARLRRSPQWPAIVLVFIVSVAAGLFAWSYTYAMANPTPHRLPTAVIGSFEAQRGEEYLAGLGKALNSSVTTHEYASKEAALEAVEDQRVFAILELRDGGRHVVLDVTSASGASVAELLRQAAPAVGRETGVSVTVRDVNPLQKGDPRGLAIFYISLAAVIIGFIGAIQLSVHAPALTPAERIAFTDTYALLGGFAIAAAVDWLLGALALPFAESWSILALTMFTSGMTFTMFNTLMGRWAMIPTWGVMVVLGNPSSGGAVSWPLLPSVLGTVGRWLPPGASVNAQHTAVYFSGHQHAFPFLVLTGWAVVSSAVFLIWHRRHPGGRESRPADEQTPDGGESRA